MIIKIIEIITKKPYKMYPVVGHVFVSVEIKRENLHIQSKEKEGKNVTDLEGRSCYNFCSSLLPVGTDQGLESPFRKLESSNSYNR